MRLRLLALAHFKQGESRYQIAEYIKVSHGRVNRWVSNFLAHGLDGLVEPPRSGRPNKLNQAQLTQLSAYVEKQAIKPPGGHLQAADVHLCIREQFDVDYKQANVYRLMHQLGFSWITSRSKHPKKIRRSPRRL
jgi:transposase